MARVRVVSLVNTTSSSLLTTGLSAVISETMETRRTGMMDAAWLLLGVLMLAYEYECSWETNGLVGIVVLVGVDGQVLVETDVSSEESTSS